MSAVRNYLQDLNQSKIPQQNLSDLYSDVELTDEEREEAIEKALFEARYTKYAAKQREEYWQKVNTPVVVKKYNSLELLDFLKQTPEFIIDEENKEIVELLCKYFANEPEFNESLDFQGRKLSLKKGILLFGSVGVGKTHLMQTFRNNQKESYQVVACQDVEGTYAKNGDDVNPKTGALGLRRFYGMLEMSTTNMYGQTTLGFLFDDLGQENINTKFFGTERNVMLEVLSQRYKNGLFESTHITTNLSADQIKEMYGIRVADRMKEMFNLISFPESAKSRR